MEIESKVYFLYTRLINIGLYMIKCRKFVYSPTMNPALRNSRLTWSLTLNAIQHYIAARAFCVTSPRLGNIYELTTNQRRFYWSVSQIMIVDALCLFIVYLGWKLSSQFSHTVFAKYGPVLM